MIIDKYIKDCMDKGPSFKAIAQSFYEHDFCDRHTYEQCQILASVIGRARAIDAGKSEEDWDFTLYLPSRKEGESIEE